MALTHPHSWFSLTWASFCCCCDQDIVTSSYALDLDEFIPRLREYLTVVNPYKRQFLISWISVLASVPDIDMLQYLPELLEGLMGMLSDTNREIRQATGKALQVQQIACICDESWRKPCSVCKVHSTMCIVPTNLQQLKRHQAVVLSPFEDILGSCISTF